MATCTAGMALRLNKQMVEKKWLCARNKPEMLGINGMRWYMTMALECNSMVVDTMSCRGMVTHVKRANGWMETFYRNVIHRLDGPAAEHADGAKEWYVNGKRHRVDGPAVEAPSNYRRWLIYGKPHRLDGPAVEAWGMKEWWVDGERHRLNGPAVERANGKKEWWVFGVRQK